MTFDTSTWEEISFGEIARSLTNTVKNPLSENLVRYVGLEHIEPGNIHIKSWGNVADGTTFTRVFRKGQVLFGKRRAYQKKAAVAEFDGVCSGDILVLESIEEKMSPELLPFIVQSDRFFDCAVKTSAGSLSPRTKFKDLAKFTFKLPPLNEQKRITDLLWGIDDVSEKYIDMVRCVSNVKDSILKSFFEKQPKLKRKRLEDLASLITKGTTPTTAGFKFLDKGINFIKAESISEDKTFLPNKFGFISDECHESFKRSQLLEGDILFSIAGVLGRCAIVTESYVPANINQALALIRIADQSVKNEYAMLFLTSRYVLEYFNRISVKTAQVNISLKQIGDLEVPIPDLIVQNNLVDQIKKIQGLHREYLLHIRQIVEIKKSIINQIFG